MSLGLWVSHLLSQRNDADSETSLVRTGEHSGERPVYKANWENVLNHQLTTTGVPRHCIPAASEPSTRLTVEGQELNFQRWDPGGTANCEKLRPLSLSGYKHCHHLLQAGIANLA
jgi:hypothetical protein